MKKIFTLIAMAVMAFSANAQTWDFTQTQTTADQFKADAANWEATSDTRYTYLAATDKEAFKLGSDELPDTKGLLFVGGEKKFRIDLNSRLGMNGKNISVIIPGLKAGQKVTVEAKSANTSEARGFNVENLTPESGYFNQTTLEDQVNVGVVTADGDVTLTTTAGMNVFKIVVEGGEQGGGQGQGGSEQPSGEVEKYVAAPDGKLAAEFAAVVDGENATNVVDGKSVVTITTANVTVEAVGGATPANVDGGSQDITPGSVVDAEKHRYEVASVGSWNNVTWKNGQNKTDINDEAGTKLYFVIGSGNPYIKMYAEEIYTDEAPTGRYRAAYDYYKPGMDMPQVGLYYKFTTKVDGKMKVQVWANKGNRNTYLINGQTKEAVAYQATGYVNGQKVVDENNEKVLNAEGQEMMRLFTPEEIQERHNAKKVGEDGVDTAPYVIDEGGQAFWGWILFDAKAGVDYWLFQDSSQVGFGGFEFTTGGTDGIENVQVVKVQNNKIYNLQGQVVGDDYKGIVIKNGKKFLKK